MKILHLSAECYPVAKVGGLADVVGSLPKYQNKIGCNASVAMPWYDSPFVHENKFENVFEGIVVLRNLQFPFKVLKEKKDVLGFPLYLIKIDGLTDRPNVYGYNDAALQYIGFQTVALYWIRENVELPDLIHCHDHHCGLIPFMKNYTYEFEKIKNIPTVGTIHNGQYQGQMGWEMINYFPDFDLSNSGLLDWDDCINPLAAMVKCAHAFTTVSEGYLNELMNGKGAGLESLYRQESQKGFGIVNGIDTEVWNPKTDKFLVENYGPTNFVSKKRINKKELYQRYGLNESLPLVSFIGRFAFEKGADLLPDIVERSIMENGGDVNFMVLGSGDKNVENRLKDLAHRYQGNFGLETGYNEPLSHLIYAASDYLIMPSRVEPCGLNQLYSMTYGTIPIVRKTGGLRDTVPDISEENGRGFQFEDSDVNGACWAINRALNFESNQKESRALKRKIMKIDFSWEKSAEKYLDLYKKIKQ